MLCNHPPDAPARGTDSVPSQDPGCLDRMEALLALRRSGTKIPEAAFLVFAVLLAHRNPETGEAWPSVATICERTSLARSAVQRGLAFLRGHRLICATTTGSKGRGASTHYLVAPTAQRGDVSAVYRRGRDHDPITEEKGPPARADSIQKGPHERADILEKGPPPRTLSDEKGPSGASKEPSCEGPITRVLQVPPQPPQGGTGSAPRTPTPAPAPAGHPQRPPNPDDYAPPPREAVVADQAFERIKRLGRVDREFAVRQVCVRFVAAGGGMPELEALIGEAGRPQADGSHRLGGGKIGIVVHWLEDAGRWRSVVGDSSERAKLSQIRKRASGVSTLVRASEMVGAS